MTVEQLRRDAENPHSCGVLVYRRSAKRSPRGMTAALLPGLNGRVVGTERDSVTIMVRAQDVLAWLDLRMSPQAEGTAK